MLVPTWGAAPVPAAACTRAAGLFRGIPLPAVHEVLPLFVVGLLAAAHVLVVLSDAAVPGLAGVSAVVPVSVGHLEVQTVVVVHHVDGVAGFGADGRVVDQADLETGIV